MNEWLDLSDGGWWHVAGWTMLHFLWLGTLVGLAAGACRLLLRHSAANLRYAAALVCFVALAALPIGIGAWLSTKPLKPLANEAAQSVLPNADPIHAAPGSAGGLLGAARPEVAIPNQTTMAREPAIDMQAGSNPRQSRGLADVVASVAGYLPWAWLTGTPLTFLLLVTGVVGAERLRRSSRIVDDGPIAEACAELAKSLHIGGQVTVAACERIAAPVLIGIVRPMILLPPAALTGWSPEEIEMVLLHELAHVRRWDNLVNLLQRFVEAALFFHPAVWLVSRWVRAEREACCDAVVVGRTQRPQAYAEMLVEFATLLSSPGEPGRPRPRVGGFTRGRGRPGSLVGSAMAAGPLRSRIHRILALDTDPMLVSGKSLGIVMSSLLLAATLVVLNLPTSTRAESEPTNKSISADDPTLVGVPFEVGATKFADGDEIKVSEIRGTSNTFKPGNEYWIKGTYTLRSQDRATLGASVTAPAATDAVTPHDPDQSIEIKRGSGEFTLKLPMHRDGWPHISFYPIDGGQSFGGVYFGTGSNVLKKWWDEKNRTAVGNENAVQEINIGKMRAATKNNLREQAIALLNYQDALKTLPPSATFDASGKPLLSWRVLVLPYLPQANLNPDSDEAKLYREFHLDEPWDSEHNRKLISRMPKVFKNPQIDREGFTNYLAVVGKECVFDDQGRPIRLAQITDGTANTIALVEADADRAAEWTKPQDWDFDRAQPTAGLGALWPDYWIAAWVDGSVRSIENGKVADEAGIQFTRAGGETRSLSESAGKDEVAAYGEEPLVGNPKRKFPTLEEQKLADLAYRRLGIELAPLNDDQLKRVKTLGYGGGLSVTSHSEPVVSWNEIRDGDLLVGLAIWPTTSLKAAGAVLNRDDLGDLSPLKFYVVRNASTSEDNGKTYVMKDMVVTGRIHVNLDNERPRATAPATDRYSAERSKPLTPQQMAEMITPQPAQTQPQARTRQPADNLVDPLPAAAAKILREKGPIVVDVYYLNRSEPCRQTLANVKLFQRTNLNLPVEINRRNAEVELAAVAKYEIDRTPAIVVTKDGVVLKKESGALSTEDFSQLLLDVAVNLAGAAEDQPTLRYQGKTFDEWRTAWQTELSLEKRLEVVKALAAFGASGRGDEAAEAILDVANQLDWSFIDSETAAGRLKQACVDAFVSGRTTEGYRIPTEAWWSLVVPIYENSAEKQTIVTYLSYQLPAGEKELIPQLLELSNKDEATRNLALSGLKAVDPKLEDERVVSRLRQSLSDGNKPPSELRAAINSLFYSRTGGGGYGPQPELRWVPELQSLLFHPDLEVRQTARYAASKAGPRDAAPLVEYLIDVINMHRDERERREAIRALAALGIRAAPAEEKLEAIARDPNDSSRIPAAVALLALWPDVANWGIDSKLDKLFGEKAIAAGDSDDTSRKLQAEQDAVFGIDRQSYGGGGMF